LKILHIFFIFLQIYLK